MSTTPPPPQIIAVIKLKCTPATREEWDKILSELKALINSYNGKMALAEPVVYQELHSQI